VRGHNTQSMGSLGPTTLSSMSRMAKAATSVGTKNSVVAVADQQQAEGCWN